MSDIPPSTNAETESATSDSGAASSAEAGERGAPSDSAEQSKSTARAGDSNAGSPKDAFNNAARDGLRSEQADGGQSGQGDGNPNQQTVERQNSETYGDYHSQTTRSIRDMKSGDLTRAGEFNRPAGDNRTSSPIVDNTGKKEGGGTNTETGKAAAALEPGPGDGNNTTKKSEDEADSASGGAPKSPEMQKALDEFAESKADITGSDATAATSRASFSPGQEASADRTKNQSKPNGPSR